MDLFASNIFSRPKSISKVAIIKTKSVTVFFFLFSFFPSPRSLFFLFPFPSLLWFWSFSGLRNLLFEAFSLKWLHISLGWFCKKSVRCIYVFRGLKNDWASPTNILRSPVVRGTQVARAYQGVELGHQPTNPARGLVASLADVLTVTDAEH